MGILLCVLGNRESLFLDDVFQVPTVHLFECDHQFHRLSLDRPTQEIDRLILGT
ncbi:hypothetical protein AALP_AA5G223600 [Arabis alpina]|uniref:Uncharacterized protein n=1 Tax=Arabis alpina TaxID=50452 RepID=A0A087GYR7_ARAAL|nr:hypothetical protein AALP_AA5G223600 [Arabis alpina]